VVDDGEICDDGNDIDDDECNNLCTSTNGTGAEGEAGDCGCKVGGDSSLPRGGAFFLLLCAAALLLVRRRVI
jgi:MYXO-CTERM domain-containing protein